MLTFLFTIIGWTVARTPRRLLAWFSILGGSLLVRIAPGRRRLILSNLHHAFPDRPPAWHRRMAVLSSQRLVETVLLSVAAPFLNERQIRSIGTLGPSVEAWASDPGRRPTVFGTVHLALWESQTWFKFLSRAPLPEIGVVYRPLKNPQLDAFVRRTREQHGLRLLSRKKGFTEALGLLRSGGCAAVLFDQNAGRQGALTTFFGRVCSTTELPGILAVHSGAAVRTFHPRRTGFWKVTFESDPIGSDGTAEGITVALNRWLEGYLGAHDDHCASWLWIHDRWRNQDIPERRLRLEAKRNLLEEDVRSRGLVSLPRRTRVWVRMPNWLGDVVMALPFLRTLRASRPDAEISLVASARFLPLLDAWNVADHLVPLPTRGLGTWSHFLAMRREFPDVWLLLTNSARGDLEATVAGCPQRFGIRRPGHPRPLLTHAFALPAGFDERTHHQVDLWERFLRHFGMEGPVDWSPARAGVTPGRGYSPIGLIPGSENDPSKRWPVPHWRSLIEAFPGEEFLLLGTAGDRAVTDAVAAGFEPSRVQNMAGRTELTGFAQLLRECRLLVTNDTGGMHLANSLGVPILALFGPTNPVRTGPVFSSPFRILQPPACPPTGGGSLADLAPATVIAAVSG
jgi:ADP-heptose:LPS heptosyltransferase/lauroyl/myristoyl acyltransferase